MNISFFQKCSNCGACYNICPKGAISINDEGTFYLPVVNENLCIDCSLCTNICPVNQKYKINEPRYACAGWHKNSRIVLNSSSGGVFYGIAHNIISNGGVVFAAIYSNDYQTVNIASTDETSLEKMLKSKYVESIVDLSYQRIKSELEKGRLVLFCGTPCQVAGLSNYLGIVYDSLLTCDFVCGGLPSHKMYQEYISYLQTRYNSKIKKVDFRPKSHGWKRYAFKVDFENGKEYLRIGTEDPYLKSFLYGKYTVRDYCLECKFAESHASDITIADFWLYEKISSLRNENGISLVLCNTQKGINAINSLKEEYYISDINIEKASYNKQIKASEEKIRKHNLFINYYEHYGLFSAYKKFLPDSFNSKLKNLLIRKFLRKRR